MISLPIRTIFAVMLATGFACAQAPAEKPLPVFDAVVIKPTKEAGDNDGTDSRRSAFKGTNVTLKRLLVNAYGIREPLIYGLPSWAENDHWDVNAKVSDPDPEQMKALTKEQRRAMLQAMLAERFHLKAHIVMKVQPIYELTVTAGGPKFKASAPGETTGTGIDGNDGVIRLEGTAITLTSLADSLSPSMDRTVVDKTALAGAYNILLRWTSDRAPQPLPDDAPPVIFTAIEEQLGLKLAPTKGPAPTLVVDRVEKPTEN
jgi:uncharacterized protein (TIGR03435 family)